MTKKIKLYSDELIEVYTQELDIGNAKDIILRVLTSALIGAKSYSQLAKEPIKLWKLIKKDMLYSIQITEDIIKGDIKK